MRQYQTSMDGSRLRIGVGVSRFNDVVTERLLEGALDGLKKNGVPDTAVEVAHGALDRTRCSRPDSGRFLMPPDGGWADQLPRWSAATCLLRRPMRRAAEFLWTMPFDAALLSSLIERNALRLCSSGLSVRAVSIFRLTRVAL